MLDLNYLKHKVDLENPVGTDWVLGLLNNYIVFSLQRISKPKK
ncbi:hypothetical protein [Tenacibaculum sp. nBUS_03]